MITPITHPARPVNGGHLKYALPKVGDWSCEFKYNGWRSAIHLPTRSMFNRHGELLTIAKEFDKALDSLCATLDCSWFKWADCESLERRHNIGRGTLIVLDVIPEPEHASATYIERKEWLKPFYKRDSAPTNPAEFQNDSVYFSPYYPWSQAKEKWHYAQQQNAAVKCEFYEGLVAKKNLAPYAIQLNSPEQTTGTLMKHRFIK